MSLETIQTELAALRNDVKTLTKLIRKIREGEEARREQRIQP